MSTLLAILPTVAWILFYHHLPAVVWTVVGAVRLGSLTPPSCWPLSTIVALWTFEPFAMAASSFMQLTVLSLSCCPGSHALRHA
jgi:hypothetical protein